MADRPAGIRTSALALLLILAAACGPDDSQRLAAPDGPAPTARAVPGPGEARVDLVEGRATVVCQAAPRGLVLEKLSRAARFDIVGELDARPMTLDLTQWPLEAVIAALLEDLPYRAQWQYDAKIDRHALARLEVGEISASSAAAESAASAMRAKRREMADALRQQTRERREKEEIGEDRKQEIAARREERVRSQADLLEQLRSSNPEMRVEAVEGIDPEGPALAVLLEVLRTDPDVRVREKAAEQAGEVDGFMACAGLLDALGDREPAVVLAALASVEFTCDDTVAPIVHQHCAQATDPAVQARCAEAIDFMQ